MRTKRNSIATIHVTTIALAFTLALTAHQNLQAADDDIPEFTHDGLQRVIDSKAALAYVKPGADFSAYDQVMILDCFVAFKKTGRRTTTGIKFHCPVASLTKTWNA